MLTRIFLLLCTYEVARGSLKTYCLKSDKCDDTWRPEDLDNIDAALVGYDLPSGNLKFCCLQIVHFFVYNFYQLYFIFQEILFHRIS